MRLAIALAAVCALGACRSVHVRSIPCDGPGGTLSAQAVERRRDVNEEYTFDVRRADGTKLAFFAGSGAVADLDPGRYRVLIRGTGIRTKTVDVTLRACERVHITLEAWNARKVARWREFVRSIPSFVGRAACAVLVALWEIVSSLPELLIDGLLDDDEDDDDEDDECRPREKSKPRAKSCTPRPRTPCVPRK